MTGVKEITAEELKEKLKKKEKMTLVDIRDEENFEENHLPGAIHVDQYNFNEFVENADLNQLVVVYCYRGNRSKKFIPRLLHKGFKNVCHLKGGLQEWNKSIKS